MFRSINTKAVIVLFAAQAMMFTGARAAGSPPSHHHSLKAKTTTRHHAHGHGAPGTARKSLSGIASYYADRFHGRKTSSGHPYNKTAWTAAHRTLPLGTWVRVINDKNGHSAVVQITDRGPYAKNRVIDLSRKAAVALGMTHSGTAPVHLEVMREYQPTRKITAGA